MAFYIPRGLGSRFTTLLRSCVQDNGLPFASALTEEHIQQAAVEESVNFGAGEDCVFTPAVTTWAFVSQYLAGASTCVNAVGRVIVLMVAMGREPCSAATGAYCKARAKLPEGFLRRLTYQVGNGVEDEAPDTWRWHKRRVLLVDGFETVLDDTKDNQAEYPQPTTQRPGLGFPMMRVVVFLAFATAVITGAAFGPHSGKETGETALFRQLLDQLRADDIVVADRYYCSYFMIALLRQRGADVAFRLHQRRKYDFRRGRHLGHDDHIVEWQRPQRPTWMDEATYATMPETLAIREVRFSTDNPGCRSRSIIVATTLLDDKQYSNTDIADLYQQRRHAELLFKRWKSQGLIATLSGSTEVRQMVRVWARLIAVLLQHWLVVACSWGDPTRSWGKVSEAIRAFVGRMVAALEKLDELTAIIEQLCAVVAKTCQRNKRKKPGTVELLNDVCLLEFRLT